MVVYIHKTYAKQQLIDKVYRPIIHCEYVVY